MRKLLLLLTGVLYLHCTNAQNVGIGTNTPQSTLDVRGSSRMGGLLNFMMYDSVTGRIVWRNSHLYVPVSQFLMKHSASGDGLYYNTTAPANGQLEYRNVSGNPVFYTNFTNGNGYFSGKLGIGTTTPGSILHVRIGSSGYNGTNYLLGPTIEGDNNAYVNLLTPAIHENGVHFGNPLALDDGGIIYNSRINLNGLQFRTGGNQTRMTIDAFGNIGIGPNNPSYKLHVQTGSVRFEGLQGGQVLSLSSSGSFAVDAPFVPAGRFIIQENGNVGIGTTTPVFRLDVADRMRIRSGGGFSTAGLYLNSNDNSQSPAFIGMDDDTHVGFWGSGTGWKFTMNTQTGALKVNGTEGNAGQVLQSNGNGAAASWTSKPSAIFFNQSSLVALDGSNLSADIPNINNRSFSITQNATITYQLTIPLFGSNGVGGGVSDGIVSIQVLDAGTNVVSAGSSQFSVGNHRPHQIIVAGAGNLAAGTYTIRARIARSGTGDGNTYSNTGTKGGVAIQTGQLIIQIFPN